MGSEVFEAARNKIVVLWIMRPPSFMHGYHSFGGTRSLHLRGKNDYVTV
jgi:hypothetical protein